MWFTSQSGKKRERVWHLYTSARKEKTPVTAAISYASSTCWKIGAFFLFVFDYFTCRHKYYIVPSTSALTQAAHLQAEPANRKQPKQTLDYTSHYSSRESHKSWWHEAWLSWKWGMLSHTLALHWDHLHWCKLLCFHRVIMTREHERCIT